MLKKISIFAGLLFLLFACDFKAPVLPTWEIITKVPFEVDDLIIGERLAADPLSDTSSTSPFRFDNDQLFISLDDSLQLQEISRDALSITPGGVSDVIELDTLELNSLAAIESPLIPLGALIPELTQFVGVQVTLPDTTLDPPDFVLPASDFRSINVISGNMRLSISNTLPFTIGPNSSSTDGLTIRVVSDSTNEEVAVFNFPNDIGNGGSAQSVASIGGQTINAPLRFEYTIPVKGGESFTVTSALLSDAGIAVTLELENMRADQVVARLEPQDYQDVLRVGYRDETRVRSADIASGSFILNFTNHIPLASTVNVTIPAVLRQNGNPFQVTLNLPASGELELPVLFNNDQIRNPDNPSELIDSLEVVIDAQTVPSNEFVAISAQDSVSIDVTAQTIFFRSFNGFLAPETLTIAPVFEDDLIDYEGFEGGLEFQQALLELSFASGISIENLRADVRVTAYHQEDGLATDSATLLLNDVQFQQGTPNNLLIQGQEIVDILNILPTALRFSGEVRASGNATVTRGDNIRMSYRLETPFTARISAFSTLDGDTATFDINKEFRDAAEDDALISAVLNVTFANHTPLGGDIKIVLSNDLSDGNLYDIDPQPPIGLVRTVTIDAAPVNPATGLVTGEGTRSITIELTEEELSIFAASQMQIGFQLNLNDTGNFVTMRYSDYIRMLGATEITYQANQE